MQSGVGKLEKGLVVIFHGRLCPAASQQFTLTPDPSRSWSWQEVFYNSEQLIMVWAPPLSVIVPGDIVSYNISSQCAIINHIRGVDRDGCDNSFPSHCRKSFGYSYNRYWRIASIKCCMADILEWKCLLSWVNQGRYFLWTPFTKKSMTFHCDNGSLNISSHKVLSLWRSVVFSTLQINVVIRTASFKGELSPGGETPIML